MQINVLWNIKYKVLAKTNVNYLRLSPFSFVSAEAFKKSLNLELVGPYDVLAGKCVRKNSLGRKPN